MNALRARDVLDDCKHALGRLELESQPETFRVLWVAAAALARAVGHVLKNVDAKADPAVEKAVAEAWDRWQTDKGRNAIFWEFIEKERNQVLKQYELGFFSGPVDVVAAGQQFIVGEHLFCPIAAGAYEGEDCRDVLQEAIAWWDKQLGRIEREVAGAQLTGDNTDKERLKRIQRKFQYERAQSAAESREFDVLLGVIGDVIERSCEFIEDLEESEEDGDPDLASDLADEEEGLIEELMGVAFVIAQVQIVKFCRKVALAKGITVPSEQGKFRTGLMRKSADFAGTTFKEIEVIYELGNYWKHREEWPIGSKEEDGYLVLERRPDRKRMWQVCRELGMSRPFERHLTKVAEQLGAKRDRTDFSPIIDKIRAWSEVVLEELRSEIGGGI